MILDQSVFDFSQSAGLAQNLGWDTDLAQIMNQAGHANAVDLVGWQPHFGGHAASEISHATLMAGSVWIPSLHCQCHGLDDPSHGPSQFCQSGLHLCFRILALGDIVS